MSARGMPLHQPMSGNDMPRFSGLTTMMRLPYCEDASHLDVCFVGVPLDIGTSNRPGARFGPREIRAESSLLRPYNMGSGDAPFERVQVGDVGDVVVNPYDLKDSVARIERYYTRLLASGVVPLTMGGDHTIVLPILRAVAAKHGPVALLHIDAHADTNDSMFGERVTHGTPFRRAQEEGLLDSARVFQVGLRGTGYAAGDFDWSRSVGFNVVTAEECWYQSLAPLGKKVRDVVGERPLYISFDIDALDPSFAAGTGTPEIGGLSTWQALELLRACAGARIVGADLVEVAPQYDASGNTALTAAGLLYEMLCATSANLEQVKRASYASS